jgi:transposase
MFQPLRRDRWARLEELRTGDGHQLPARLRREIEREFRRLELVLEQIKASEAERDAAVAAPAPDDVDAAKVAQLSKLGGIGTALATVLVREALCRPFTNRKEVAAGSVASLHSCSNRVQALAWRDGGGWPRRGRIGPLKDGSSRLR